MGAQHGSLAAEMGDWHQAAAFYGLMIERLLKGSYADPMERAWPMLLRPAFDVALRRLEAARPTEFRARTEAFFRSLGLPASRSRQMQVMDVFQNIVGTAGRLGLGPFAARMATRVPPACSSLAIWNDGTADGRLLHGRNFDFPGTGIWDERPVVVFCTPPSGLRYGFVSTSGADTPGVTCFNEAGIALTAHTRFHRDVAFSSSSIVDMGHDVVRRVSTLAEAIKVLSEHRSASSWGLLISSARERDSVVVELTAAGQAVIRPEADASGRPNPWRSCTNHYLDAGLAERELVPSPGFEIHCRGRMARLEQVATDGLERGGVTLQEVQALLGDHIDAEVPGFERAAGAVLGQATSVQSVVVDAEQSVIHVANGAVPTGRGPWVAVPFEWSDQPGWHQLELAATEAPSTSRFLKGRPADAYACYVEAARREGLGQTPDRVCGPLRQAVTLDPDEPSYRLLIGGMCLRDGAASEAVDHFATGIANEPNRFYRGQLQLWGSRAAEIAGRPDTARQWRRAVIGNAHPLLERYRRSAEHESVRGLSQSRFRAMPVHVAMGDVG